MPEIFITI